MGFDTGVVLLQVAGYAMVAHIACNLGLRVIVRTGAPGFEKMFTGPFWGELAGTSFWHMPVRYFVPWVAAPAEVYESSGLAVTLFWAARLAGAIFVLGIIGFLGAMIYEGIHNA